MACPMTSAGYSSAPVAEVSRTDRTSVGVIAPR